MMLLTGSLSRVPLPLLRWAPDPVVFVEPQERAQYEEAHPDVRFVSLRKSGGGFGYLLNQMVRYTLDSNEDFFVFTDDDVTDLRVRPNVGTKFSSCRGEHARSVLAGSVSLARELQCAQLAVSFAGQSWSAKKPFTDPSGAWGVHVTDARAIREVGGYDESIPCFNDWDMSARLLISGFRCLRTNLVTFVHQMRSHEGGAETVYKDKDRVAEAARRVASRYPQAARIVEVEAHGLSEVRFNWRQLIRGMQ